uniref:Putative ovule protein n=1 Tax=Solanum chacoense TaxID=4108 RepID=A0A0V0GWR2_SOLCH
MNTYLNEFPFLFQFSVWTCPLGRSILRKEPYASIISDHLRMQQVPDGLIEPLASESKGFAFWVEFVVPGMPSVG